jgi:LPXTG-motif cell wall-anchored protein
MNKNIITLLAQKIKEYRFGKIRSAVSVLLIITVACGTIFSLRKPAITMTGDIHFHTEECYDWDAHPSEWVDYLFCTADRLGIHQHTNSCFAADENGHRTLTCGIADYVVHQHTIDCTDRDGNLICGLAECLPLDPNGGYSHEHTIECYQPDGFTYEKVLIPTASDSDAAAEPASPSNASVPAAEAAPKASASDAVDTTQETAADTNEETAMTSREKEKLLKEIQSYQEIIPEKLILTGVLICGLESDSEGEIDWDEVEDDELEDYLPDEIPLVDDIHPMPAAVRSAPKEGVVHEHDSGCYDTDGTRICDFLETQEHIHDDSCYVTYPPLICEEYGVHLWEQYVEEEEAEEPLESEPASPEASTATPADAVKARKMAKAKAALPDDSKTQIYIRLQRAETDARAAPEDNDLTGAQFTLYRYDEETTDFLEAATYTVDDTGELLIEELDYDTVYRFEQTAAPDGYSLTDDYAPYYFYVSSESEELEEAAIMAADLEDEELTEEATEESVSAEISVNSIRSQVHTLSAGSAVTLSVAYTEAATEATGYTLPATGGNGTIPYTMGGLIIIFTSVGAFMYQRQRRKEDVSSS